MRGAILHAPGNVRLEQRDDPGEVFDLTLPLEQIAEGCQAMDECRAIKTLITL